MENTDEMHDALDNNKLKYMWQLNFMHWDLVRPEHNKTVDIKINRA